MNVRLLIYHQIRELNILMISAKKKSEKDSLRLPGATRTRRTLRSKMKKLEIPYGRRRG
jgi:hypothetical protein